MRIGAVRAAGRPDLKLGVVCSLGLMYNSISETQLTLPMIKEKFMATSDARCQNCGTPLMPEDTTCPSCGAAVNAESLFPDAEEFVHEFLPKC